MHAWIAWLALVSFAGLTTPLPAPQSVQPPADREPDRGFFPYLGRIVSGSGLAAGVGYRYEEILGSLVGAEATAGWSVRGYQLYRTRAGLINDARRTLELRQADAGVASMFNDTAVKRPGAALYTEIRYRSYPRHPYYGIGGESKRDDVSAFKLRGPAYDLVGQWQVSPSFGLSGRAGLLESEVGPRRGDSKRPSVEERFDPVSIPGFLTTPTYTVLGVGAALDRRDSPRDPTRGFFAGATAWRFEASGRQYDFTRVTLDARGYIPSSGPLPGVIALRLLLSGDHTAPSSLVPFFLLQTVGGAETLRSYPSHRWRERALAHVTAEYRWQPHRLVEIAPFVDIASLASTFESLSARRRLYSYGVALRGRWKGRVLGRLEWALGPEGGRVLLFAGPLF